MATQPQFQPSAPHWLGAAVFDALSGRGFGEQSEAIAEQYELIAGPFEAIPEGASGVLIERAFAEGGIAEMSECDGNPRLHGGYLAPIQMIVRPRRTRYMAADQLVEYAGPEDDMGEVAPAFLAVAGTVISAAELGLGVFDRLKEHVFNGSFSVTSTPASYIHDPSPAGLVTQTRKFRFGLIAGHEGTIVSNQKFFFVVTLEYDGFNIRRVSVVEDRGKSSDLYMSSFSINFGAAKLSAVNEPVTQIVYNIQGRWDKVGRGDESFDGRFVVDSQGNFSGLSINAPQRTVWIAGPVTQEGGGAVPRKRLKRFLTHVLFDKPGDTKLSQHMIKHLHNWATALIPAAIRAEVAKGNIPVIVTGRASTTATVQKNQEIARARAATCAKIITDVVGSSTKIEARVAGELEAKTGDKIEAPEERRCDLEIAVTEYAIF